ncbi:MAG: DUF2946 domain-containing protein [Giesbergeria sp.]|jgi:hypothetical protein
MSAARMHRILIAWSAMLAIMFGALAPTLAHALTSGSELGVGMDVCGSTGMFLMNAEATPSDEDGSADLQTRQQHCLWCSSHASNVAVPVQAIATTPLLRCAQEMPPAFYRVGFTSAVWRKALSRAPPLA